jgi:nucleoside-diphosphate-sugar epimerase
VTRGEAAAVLARAVGRKRLYFAPRFVPAMTGSYVRAMMRSTRVSSQKLTDATGWSPSYPSVREGYPAVVEELRASRL